MLPDTHLGRAISQIRLRSEKQKDIEKLTRSFVDTGIIAQLTNENNQILYGRRGTGKTHVLLYLEQLLKKQSKIITVYIDMRTLGSTSSITNSDTDLHHHAVGYFRDILAEINDTLLDYATIPENKINDNAFEKINDFSGAITQFTLHPLKQVSSKTTSKELKEETSAKLGLEGLNPVAKIEADKTASDISSDTEARDYLITESIPFQLIYKKLLEALSSIGIEHFFILIDEWASLPMGVQPALAEYIKRTLLPISMITIKIASIEYRSQFAIDQKREKIGLELGGDISAAIDLDDYYVYDRNPRNIKQLFAEVIYKHLASELPENYLATNLKITNSLALPSAIFSGEKIFVELFRASEGVVRDFINIFSMAYFDATVRHSSKIDMVAITGSALKWFEQDKVSGLTPQLEGALKIIVEEVIGRKKARTFLVIRSESQHPIIQALFDLRILHLIAKGYSDKSNPGLRYNVFTLDYGTYVDLLKTKSAPDVDLPELGKATDGAERIVPFDDKRSIRRIILDTSRFDSIGIK